MDRVIAHHFLAKLLLLMWAGITLPIWLPLVWLARWLDAHGEHNLLAWSIRLPLLITLFGLWWISKRMSYHMTIERRTFSFGVAAGIQDARLRLAFVPLIGHWFMSSRDDIKEGDDA